MYIDILKIKSELKCTHMYLFRCVYACMSGALKIFFLLRSLYLPASAFSYQHTHTHAYKHMQTYLIWYANENEGKCRKVKQEKQKKGEQK